MNLKVYILCLFTIIFCVACGKKQKAQEPPSLKTNLVLDLFHALEEGEHHIAIEKIHRLREIKDSTFLASLQMKEEQNLLIKQIQDNLDNGDISKAITICERGIESLDRNDNLIELRKKLLLLKTISDAADIITNSKDWRQKARASARIKNIAESFDGTENLIELANAKIAEAKKYVQREQKIATLDILCDLVEQRSKNQNIYDTLLAVLYNIDPSNPALKLQDDN